MIVATVLTHFGDFTGPVRRVAAARLAVARTLGEGYTLEEYDHEASMQGKYKITGPELKDGEYVNKDRNMMRHTIIIDA